MIAVCGLAQIAEFDGGSGLDGRRYKITCRLSRYFNGSTLPLGALGRLIFEVAKKASVG